MKFTKEQKWKIKAFLAVRSFCYDEAEKAKRNIDDWFIKEIEKM